MNKPTNEDLKRWVLLECIRGTINNHKKRTICERFGCSYPTLKRYVQECEAVLAALDKANKEIREAKNKEAAAIMVEGCKISKAYDLL
jgi:transposase